MELLPTDFEPGVSSLYRQVPSYTALHNDNSMGTEQPFRRGVPSYTALYPALRLRQPPRKPLNFCWRGGSRKGSCVIVKIEKREFARLASDSGGGKLGVSVGRIVSEC